MVAHGGDTANRVQVRNRDESWDSSRPNPNTILNPAGVEVFV